MSVCREAPHLSQRVNQLLGSWGAQWPIGGGSIEIVDRFALEASACECYPASLARRQRSCASSRCRAPRPRNSLHRSAVDELVEAADRSVGGPVLVEECELLLFELGEEIEAFVQEVSRGLAGAPEIDPEAATKVVLATMSRHLPAGQIKKICRELPSPLQDLWMTADQEDASEMMDERPVRQTHYHGGYAMLVSEAMTIDLYVADPDDSVARAARKMAELDAGALPVGEGDRLIGIVTDRDIAVRAVAAGKGPEARVRDVMSEDVEYCFDDQELDEVTETKGNIQVRRLPVINRDKRLVGILSLNVREPSRGA
jgi:CBS domain-containing protein